MSVIGLFFSHASYSGVTVYANCNYSGASKIITTGAGATQQELANLGLDNTISSFKIDPGSVLYLYPDAGNSGQGGKFFHSVDCLTDEHFDLNNKASSIKTRAAGVKLFENSFSGTQTTISVNKVVPKISDIGIRNDQISSIAVDPGYKVTVYEHATYNGRLMSFTSNVDLSFGEGVGAGKSFGFNDKISSLKVEKVGVTLYENCNFSGKSIKLSPGDYKNSVAFGMGDNQVSSIKFDPGYSASLYDLADFNASNKNASTVNLNANLACLTAVPKTTINFNDKLSSIKVTYGNPIETSNMSSSECGSLGATIAWKAGQDFLGALPIPGVSNALSFAASMAEIGVNSRCGGYEKRLQQLVSNTIKLTLTTASATEVSALNKGLEDHIGSSTTNINTFLNYYNSIATRAGAEESDVAALGFEAFDLQVALAQIKLGSIALSMNGAYTQFLPADLTSNKQISYLRLIEKEAQLESHLNSAQYGYCRISNAGNNVHYQGFIQYEGGNRILSPRKHIVSTGGASSTFQECYGNISNVSLTNTLVTSAWQDAIDLLGSMNHQIRNAVLNSGYQEFKTKISTVMTTEEKNARFCNAKTVSRASSHTKVEFQLPKSLIGTEVKYKHGGAYKYVVPQCHHVAWDNMTFTCNENQAWEEEGYMRTDGFCDSTNTTQPYMLTTYF